MNRNYFEATVVSYLGAAAIVRGFDNFSHFLKVIFFGRILGLTRTQKEDEGKYCIFEWVKASFEGDGKQLVLSLDDFPPGMSEVQTGMDLLEFDVDVVPRVREAISSFICA